MHLPDNICNRLKVYSLLNVRTEFVKIDLSFSVVYMQNLLDRMKYSFGDRNKAAIVLHYNRADSIMANIWPIHMNGNRP